MADSQTRTAAQEADFRRSIDDLRARYRVSDVVRRRTKLRRSGSEWKGLCPFHREKTASFYVNDVRQYAHCFGCGWHGDVIDFVQQSERVSFIEAVCMIDAAALPVVKPEDLVKARAEDDREKEAAIADARHFWEEAGPVGNTPADLYLCWRKIYVRPPTIRFARIPTWKNPRTGRWNAPRPALLLRAENLAGEFVGIQRIYLTEDGGKARMEKPKLSLGRIHGASIRFGQVRADVTVTGGPEDGLTLYQRYAEQVTIYVSCGEAMLPFIQLPRFCSSVTIARQNDKAGEIAADRARAAFVEQGRRVRGIAPGAGFKDWNDELRGIRAHG